MSFHEFRVASCRPGPFFLCSYGAASGHVGPKSFPVPLPDAFFRLTRQPTTETGGQYGKLSNLTGLLNHSIHQNFFGLFFHGSNRRSCRNVQKSVDRNGGGLSACVTYRHKAYYSLIGMTGWSMKAVLCCLYLPMNGMSGKWTMQELHAAIACSAGLETGKKRIYAHFILGMGPNRTLPGAEGVHEKVVRVAIERGSADA